MRVLYVDVDSLRPDHLGCYGYDRETSPTIDRLASEGRRFTNYYAADVPCLPSRTGLFLSRFGFHTGVINHGGLNADPRRHGLRRGFGYPDRFRSWMAVLANDGFHTASISPFPSRHDAWQVLEGVTDFTDPGDSTAHAGEIYPHVENWLNQHGSTDNWFLHVNFWDPHTMYNTPIEYGNTFENDEPPGWLTQDMLDEQNKTYGPHSAFSPPGSIAHPTDTTSYPRMPDRIETLEDFSRWIDGYDIGVRFMDDHIGKLVELLRDLEIFDETLMIVSGDHGENLGELNVYGDHQTADEYTCHVPLIVHGPAIAPGVDRDFHYQVDLAPTICDRVEIDTPDGWDGRSFVGSLTEGASNDGREYIVASQGAWACQRGVRWDDWYLLRTYDDGMKEALSDVMLFDLTSDPHQTTNLAEERPEIVSAGLSRLQRWLDERLQESATGRNGGNPRAPGGVTDPMWNVIREGGPWHARTFVDDYVAHLEDVGRDELARMIESKYGGLHTAI